MKFHTDRLEIRPFRDSDLEDVFNIYNQEETCKYLLHDQWTEENKQEEFAKKIATDALKQDTAISLAVLKDTKVIGDLSVWYTGMKDTVEIGYSFSNEVAGKGYASEAVRGLIEKLFVDYNVHRIQATLDARNDSSSKLCQRVGMRKEAHYLQDFWNKGEWTDSFVYGMLRSDLD